MVNFELHDEEQNITQKPHQFNEELKFIVFQLVMEMREVIEIFSTKDFLGISGSKDPEEDNI